MMLDEVWGIWKASHFAFNMLPTPRLLWTRHEDTSWIPHGCLMPTSECDIHMVHDPLMTQPHGKHAPHGFHKVCLMSNDPHAFSSLHASFIFLCYFPSSSFIVPILLPSCLQHVPLHEANT